MSTFKITSSPRRYKLDEFLRLGGPDLSNTVNANGVYITHHLLNVTGKAVPQPVYKEGKFFLLIGQIYDYDKSLPSDIYYGIEKYLEHGDSFTNYIDGEFLFVIYDPAREEIDFFTDPWATKQSFYYYVGEDFYFSTFPIKEPRGGRFLHKTIQDKEWLMNYKEMPPNSHYKYDVKKDLLYPINEELHKWDLNQYKDSLEDITAAFEEAVSKRYCENIVLFLSGGLDSTVVALSLADQKKFFNSISVLNDDSEDIETLNQVLDYTKTYNNNHKIYSISKTNEKYKKQRQLLSEANIGPDYQFCVREHVIEQFNSNVTLMGEGADQVLENYMSKGKSDFSIWPEDLSTIFPWKYFYGKASDRKLTNHHECISSAYGQEVRNVYCDKKLVQEWLNLSVELKNSEHKPLQKKYLRDRNIKIPEKVSGFGYQSYPHLKP